LATSGLLLGSLVSAHAIVLFDQGPQSGPINAFFTDMASGQNFADQFNVAQNSMITDYDFFTNLDPSTFGTIQLQIFSNNNGVPGSLLSVQDLSAADYILYDGRFNQPIWEVDLILTTPFLANAGAIYWAGAAGIGFDSSMIALNGSRSPLADANVALFNGSTYAGADNIGDQAFILEGKAVPAPEPMSLAVLGLGVVGLVARRRLKR
jgi:hypothetical protein